MTEAEWLASEEPSAMLARLRDQVSDRKLRLFAVACCRRIEALLAPESRLALLVAEELADGQVFLAPESRQGSNQQRKAARGAAMAAGRPGGGAAKEAVMWALAESAPEAAVQAAECALHAAAYDAWRRAGAVPYPSWVENRLSIYHAFLPVAKREQGALLRDVFGSPFRPPPAIDPAWLAWKDGTVARLAKAMYEKRDFDHLPILADALEEAGCADAELLRHCRTPALHARGCWAVDAVLARK
jgi:hypothetical protein